ncbi:hypothetical protein ARMSODRAFT_980038 [Armillaria solidipes]|uniref:Uncharacterized protein n=1 Tax=Armillaria solidipes TaxID=1076256 RepID=A0A2H3AXF1_9AGAR|nr:hypothetical protein ARMSODRAFT_980038 [Armillaria solidipes]
MHGGREYWSLGRIVGANAGSCTVVVVLASSVVSSADVHIGIGVAGVVKRRWTVRHRLPYLEVPSLSSSSPSSPLAVVVAIAFRVAAGIKVVSQQWRMELGLVDSAIAVKMGNVDGRESKQWWSKGTRKSAAQPLHRWAVVRFSILDNAYVGVAAKGIVSGALVYLSRQVYMSTRGAFVRRGVWQRRSTGSTILLKAEDPHTDSTAKISALFSQHLGLQVLVGYVSRDSSVIQRQVFIGVKPRTRPCSRDTRYNGYHTLAAFNYSPRHH